MLYLVKLSGPDRRVWRIGLKSQLSLGRYKAGYQMEIDVTGSKQKLLGGNRFYSLYGLQGGLSIRNAGIKGNI